MVYPGRETGIWLQRLVACCAIVALLGFGSAAWGAKPKTKPKAEPAHAQAVKPAEKPAKPPAPKPDEPVTEESIQAQMDRLNAAKGLDEGVKNQAIDIYKQALAQVKAAGEHAAAIAQFEDVVKNGPAKIDDLQKKLQENPGKPSITVPPDATLSEMEQSLASAEADLAQARSSGVAIQDELDKRGDRLKKLPDELAAARQSLEELEKATAEKATEAPTDSPEVAAAKETLDKARHDALDKEVQADEKETESYDLRGELAKLQSDISSREVAQKEEIVRQWHDAVTKRRNEEAKKAIQQAQDAVLDAAKATPKIREYAQQLAAENAAIVDARIGDNGISKEIDTASQQLKGIDSQLNELTNELGDIKDKMKSAGNNMTPGLLMMLLRQKEMMPDMRGHQQAISARQDTIAQVQEQSVKLHDERLKLSNLDEALKEAPLAALHGIDPQQRSQIETLLKGLLETKRKSLDALLHDYDTYFEKLVDLDAKERALLAKADEYTAYINQRVLWMRSGPLLRVSDLRGLVNAFRQIFSPSQWAGVAVTFGTGLIRSLGENIALAAVFVAFMVLRARLSKRLSAWGETASKSSAQVMKPTFLAVLASAILALPAPAIVWWAGWRLGATARATDFASVAGPALKSSAYYVFLFELLRQALRPQGLAELHFRWPAAPLATVRRWLLWILLATTAAMFMLSLLRWYSQETWREPFRRIILMPYFLCWALFAHAMMRPGSGAIVTVRNLLHKADSVTRQYAWYGSAVAVPVVLAVITFIGYSYTALRLNTHLLNSLAVFMGLIFLRALAWRWLTLARRRLAIKQARQKREAAREQAEASSREDDSAEDRPDAAPEEFEIDLEQIDTRMSHLVNPVFGVLLLVGLWYIWSAELPALEALDQIKLWKGTEISIWDLACALLVGAVTLIAAADVPALIELIILQRMQLLKGERYAITTIIRYAIGLLGAVLVFRALGIGWASVQWLVAALGVGLGFGLQEIFANFVSGIIILFERPIRVGDIVTVSGMSGTVSRIRIRATWITDFDRKEVIIPNKEFVTGRVTNWTLVDSVMRMVIPVGIAHGSDPALAEQILRSIVSGNSNVLKDPGPAVVFTGITETALTFEIRLYCLLENSQQLQNDLCAAVEKKLREAGISLAARHEISITTAMEGGLKV